MLAELLVEQYIENVTLLLGEAKEVYWKQHNWQDDHSVGQRSDICPGMYRITS